MIAHHGRLFEMTRPQIEAALESGVRTAVATFGATEQHGLHLPMGTDALWGEELGRRVAQELGDALVVPGLRIGCSEHHMDFAGSLTLEEETFAAVVLDTCRSLARHGFSELVLIPTHGGNFNPLAKAAATAQAALTDVRIVAWTNLAELMEVLFGVAERFGISEAETGAHAGENETSMILALRPDLVDLENAEPGFVGDHLAQAQTIFESGFKAVTENGVLGDPRRARAEIGEAYLEALTERVVRFVRRSTD